MRHKTGRPPKDAVDVLALRMDGRWIKDDGRKHVAFSFRVSGWPYAISAPCQCRLVDERCPSNIARHKTAQRWQCSNGLVFT